MKKILPILLTLFLIPSLYAQFFDDLVVGSANGIWTDSRAFTSLGAAITAVGANERTIVVTIPQVVTTLTVPANVTLRFERNGSITNSAQLTINTKNIVAPSRRIFTGVGDVDFAQGTVVKTGWFADFPTAVSLTSDDYVTLLVSEPYTVTTSCALGTNVQLKWESPRNRLTVNGGVVLSNIGQIEAGDYPIFLGAGDYDFLDGVELNLRWFSNLRAAITWVETERVTLIIPGTHVVDLSDTIQSNISTDFSRRQGQFSVSAGITLSITGPILAGRHQVFSGLGTTNLTQSLVYPDWWGSIPNDGVDDSAAIQKAIDSITLAGGGLIDLPGGVHKMSSQLIISDRNVQIVGKGQFIGGGTQGTLLSFDNALTGAVTSCIHYLGTAGVSVPSPKLQSLRINMGTGQAQAIYAEATQDGDFSDLYIYGTGTAGQVAIQLETTAAASAIYNNFKNLGISNVDTGIYFFNHDATFSVADNEISNVHINPLVTGITFYSDSGSLVYSNFIRRTDIGLYENNSIGIKMRTNAQFNTIESGRIELKGGATGTTGIWLEADSNGTWIAGTNYKSNAVGCYNVSSGVDNFFDSPSGIVAPTRYARRSEKLFANYNEATSKEATATTSYIEGENIAYPSATSGRLTINGTIRFANEVLLGRRNLTVVAGTDNDNLVLADADGKFYTFYRITTTTGTAAFSTSGFVPPSGIDHVYWMTLYNYNGYQWTINNEDASSTAANRINTLTGANVVMRNGQSFATFYYDVPQLRWVLADYSTTEAQSMIYSGTGSPEGVVTASLGSIYLNKSGGAAVSIYIKETAPTASTGWVGK